MTSKEPELENVSESIPVNTDNQSEEKEQNDYIINDIGDKAYYGKMYEEFMNELHSSLNSTFDQYINNECSWMKEFPSMITAQNMQNMSTFYPLVLLNIKQKILQNFMNEFTSIQSKKHMLKCVDLLLIPTENEISDMMNVDEEKMDIDQKSESLSIFKMRKMNSVLKSEIEKIDKHLMQIESNEQEIIRRIQSKKELLLNKI